MINESATTSPVSIHFFWHVWSNEDLLWSELGVNMSGIPIVKEHTADGVYVTETKNLPVISPVIGFYGEIQFGKHF